MADDVQVTFGAKIDGLVAGVGEVKNQLASIKESTEKVSDSAKSMLEVFGVGLSFAGFVEFINKMSELGERMQQAGERLGLTSQKIVELSGIATLTGTSLEGLSMGIERMSLNIQRAASNSIDPTAQALKVLGLNAKELVGLPTDQYFDKLAEAVSKLEPSLNRFNALQIVGGRGVATMIGSLSGGAEGLAKYRVAITAASEGLASAVPGMAETNTQIGLLSLSAQSFGARLFTVLKPAIDAIVKSVTNWLQAMDSTSIIAAASKIASAVAQIISTVGTFAISVMGMLDQMMSKMDTFGSKASAAAGGMAGGALGGAVVGGPIGAAIGGIGGGLAGWFGAEFAAGDKAAKDGEEKYNERIRALGAILLKFQSMTKQIIDSMNPTPAEDKPKGQDAAAINFNIANQLAAQATALDAQIAALQANAERKKSIYQFELETFQTTQSQMTQKLRDSLNDQYEDEKELIQKKLALYAGQPEKRAAILKELSALDQKYATDSLKVTQDQVKSQVATWKEVTDALQSSFNGQLRGMLAGTVSFGQAFKSILGDMIIFFIQAVEKMVVNWALGKAAEVATTTEAEAAKTGIVAASSTAQMAAQLPLILKNIAASVGSVFAGVAGFLAPLLGPAAPAAAAGVAAGVESTAIALTGSAEKGAYDVTGGLWQLHDKEMVLPAPVAESVRDMMEGGGPNGSGGGLHLHGMLIDGQSVARFARDHAGVFADAISGKRSLSPSRK